MDSSQHLTDFDGHALRDLAEAGPQQTDYCRPTPAKYARTPAANVLLRVVGSERFARPKICKFRARTWLVHAANRGKKREEKGSELFAIAQFVTKQF